MNLTAWLSIYPLIAVLLGIIYFIQGPIYWGGFHLLGAGYVAVAFVMKLFPMWSPVFLGVYPVLFFIPLGLYLLRLGKSPTFRK